MDGQPAITPRSIGEVVRDNRMMQRPAFARLPGRRFTRSAMHSRQRRTADQLWRRRIRKIEDSQNVIAIPIEMRRRIRIAAAKPPNSVQPNSVHGAKADLTRRCCQGNVIYPQPCLERPLATRKTIFQWVGEIIFLVLILL